MSTSNPTLLNQKTRFRPASSRRQSRSPSRSPVRKAQFTAQEIDPLLGNLSPTSTLKALSLTEALRANQSKDPDILARSIAETSTDERAYGIKAALAAQKLREWHAEVLGWKWPARRDRRLGKGFQTRPNSASRDNATGPNTKQKQYVGSLPTTVLAQHEERIEQIRDGLEALDVEELKQHVLSAHVPSRSRLGTSDDLHNGVVQLSDFTAVITHTMLQALPYLSKLTALLGDWDIRIVVLKHVPRLLRRLEEAQTQLESASERVCSRRTSGLLTRALFEETKAALEYDVSRLGTTFDKLLDLLEGREDSLPEIWIDRMDKVEASFAQWTVEAERRVLYNEWMEQNRTSSLERDRTAEVSNPTGSTAMAGETGPCTNSQTQSSTDLKRGFRDGQSPGPTPEKLLRRDASTRSQQPKLHDQTTHPAMSPVLHDSQDLYTARAAALPHNKQDGTDLMEELQSVVYPMASSNMGSPSRRSQKVREKVSSMSTSPEPLPSGPLLPDRSSRSAPGATVPEPLGQQYCLSPDHENSSLVDGPRIKQPLTLSLAQTNHKRDISQISIADSMVSEAFSDLSQAEIVDATTAEVLGSPKIVRRFVTASRDDLSDHSVAAKAGIKSMHFPRQDMPMVGPARSAHKKAASMSFAKMDSTSPLPIKASDTVADGEHDVQFPEIMAHHSTPEPVPSRRTILHRASISSVEKIPKNRIRNIMISRKDSSASSRASPVSPLDTGGPDARSASALSVSPIENLPSTSLSRKLSGRDYFETARRNEESPSITSIDHLPQATDTHEDIPGVPRRSSKRLSRGTSASRVPTLSTAARDLATTPTKSFHEPQDAHSALQLLSRGASPTQPDDLNAIRPPYKGKAKAQEDLLESKIQSLLTRIPARIRLLADSDAEDPPHPSTASSSRSQSPVPSIILSPVKPKRRPQTSNPSTPNSDVRTFHLTRSSDAHNTPPIKLFVRLVGEQGERVMVRVGGGWADLADYLRDYSLHHSKRGLTNGQYELASFPVGGQKDSRVIPVGPEVVSKAKSSTPIISNSKSPANSRPGSAMDHRPSAVTPFGVLHPTRRRRSTSATAARQQSDIQQNLTSSSPTYIFSSDADNINTLYDTPPVPSIPQIRTLNPYFGGDPRSGGPARPQSRAGTGSASSYSPLTPGPSRTHTHSRTQTPDILTPTVPSPQQQQRRPSLGSTAARAALTASPIPTHNRPSPLVTTRRSRPTTPAATKIFISPAAGNAAAYPAGLRDMSGAPAPNIGNTHPSSSSNGSCTGGSPTTSPNSKSRRMSGGLGGKEKEKGGGGIRRVFFRRKTGMA
jgi:hypothetical protein